MKCASDRCATAATPATLSGSAYARSMASRARSRRRVRSSASRLMTPSAPAAHRGDIHLVAIGIGECPPGRCVFVADHAATGSQRGSDAVLGLVDRHPYGDMDRTATIRPRLVHLLEPE